MKFLINNNLIINRTKFNFNSSYWQELSFKQYESSSDGGLTTTPVRFITGSRESLTRIIPSSPRLSRDRIPPRSPPGSTEKFVAANLPYSSLQR